MLDENICKTCIRKEWEERGKQDEILKDYCERCWDDWWNACWQGFELCPCRLFGSWFRRYTGFPGDFGQLIEDGPPSECPYLLEQILKTDEMQQKGVPPYVFSKLKARCYKWSPELIEKRRKMAANNKRP